MLEASRRSFLGGLITLTAVTVGSRGSALAEVPRIFGDGEHDDWAGLQALFDGKPFCSRRGLDIVATEDTVAFRGGTFRMGKTLVINRPNVHFSGGHFIGQHNEGVIFHLTDKAHACILRTMHFEYKGSMPTTGIKFGDGEAKQPVWPYAAWSR